MKKKSRKQKRSDLLPLLLISVGVLMVVGVLIWQATRSMQTAAPASPTQASQNTGATVDPTSGIERVTLEDAKAALNAGDAVFLDVRDSESFAQAHIPGAVNIPLALLQNRAAELDPDQWIITYCT